MKLDQLILRPICWFKTAKQFGSYPIMGHSFKENRVYLKDKKYYLELKCMTCGKKDTSWSEEPPPPYTYRDFTVNKKSCNINSTN